MAVTLGRDDEDDRWCEPGIGWLRLELRWARPEQDGPVGPLTVSVEADGARAMPQSTDTTMCLALDYGDTCQYLDIARSEVGR